MPLPSDARDIERPAEQEADSSAWASGDGASALGCLILVARHHGVHLTLDQIVHDNVLSSAAVSDDQLVQCAKAAGLRAYINAALTQRWVAMLAA